MPIYEYVCRACGIETEIMQKLSEPPARKCPDCGKLKLTKQVSAAGFRLGGGGWYETDFKKDGKRNLVEEKGAGDKGDAVAKPADKSDKAEKPEKKEAPKEPARKASAKAEAKKTPK